MSALVTAAALAEELASDAPPRVVDVRWRLDGTETREHYEAAHIPGAVYADLDTELSTHGAPEEGRHPVPSLPVLQDAARRWGLNAGDRVVVLDGGLTLAAARAWWLLDGAGVDVRVLNGGMPAWTAAGFPVESGEVTPAAGDIVLERLPDAIDIDEAAAFPADGVLLDVRAGERFRGEVEPIDPIAGHIPGAVNLPAPTFMRADGTFRDAAEIAAALDDAGATAETSVAAYCGSGVTAAQAALAARIAGRELVVFPGSWSAWSNTPGREIATGAS